MRRRKMREFQVTLVATVRISPRAIRQGMSKEVARDIAPMPTPERVAEHIAFNMVVNQLDLTQIDGFANLPEQDAECERAEVDDVVEVKPAKRARR